VKDAVKTQGFTLLELAVVLLILAIVAGAVTLHLETPLRRARMRDLVDDFAAFDRFTRTQAREQDRPLRLEADLGTGRLRWTNDLGTETLGAPLLLPSDYRIARMFVRGQDLVGGCAAVSCSRQGLMPTYALLLAGSGRTSQWILVAGLTGQCVEMDSEDAVRKTFAALRPRPDAR
jgi:prepilin-type N-terminal cleavage/methylation domain-containing protein